MGNGSSRGEGRGRRDTNPEAGEDKEWTFLATFERQYGSSTHPFFYTCRFPEALKIADEERKFVFIYLHSPADRHFTPAFCKHTLSSDRVVQYLDDNFVTWGALADRGEGRQMAKTLLRPGTFPCCAVVAPAAGEDMTVLQQMEGPMSPEKLVEILRRTVEDHGLAFGHERAKERKRSKARAKEEEKLREEKLKKKKGQQYY
ncbi:unnamed protein product [Linum tenue]|uniref:UAS domain-containing protein n=1 Tax=Linum tenue TaxID=586396 RepID=A0AAV0QQA9_9ROSI|nr:unnamed protein product [Linum tenue]